MDGSLRTPRVVVPPNKRWWEFLNLGSQFKQRDCLLAHPCRDDCIDHSIVELRAELRGLLDVVGK